jgi:hypothetical protein
MTRVMNTSSNGEPVCSWRRISASGACHLTIPAEPVRLRLTNLPTMVTNRGGGYFCLPSLAALRRLSA